MFKTLKPHINTIKKRPQEKGWEKVEMLIVF